MAGRQVVVVKAGMELPAVLEASGPKAKGRASEFLGASMRNHNTRKAYIRALASFFGFLEIGGTLEKARQMAARASTRTTQLYDRREDRGTLDEVVKINIKG